MLLRAFAHPCDDKGRSRSCLGTLTRKPRNPEFVLPFVTYVCGSRVSAKGFGGRRPPEAARLMHSIVHCYMTPSPQPGGGRINPP